MFGTCAKVLKTLYKIDYPKVNTTMHGCPGSKKDKHYGEDSNYCEWYNVDNMAFLVDVAIRQRFDRCGQSYSRQILQIIWFLKHEVMSGDKLST